MAPSRWRRPARRRPCQTLLPKHHAALRFFESVLRVHTSTEYPAHAFFNRDFVVDDDLLHWSGSVREHVRCLKEFATMMSRKCDLDFNETATLSPQTATRAK